MTLTASPPFVPPYDNASPIPDVAAATVPSGNPADASALIPAQSNRPGHGSLIAPNAKLATYKRATVSDELPFCGEQALLFETEERRIKRWRFSDTRPSESLGKIG